MPLTAKGEKIMHAMEKEYGKDKGERVFYASKNKGTISGVDSTSRLDAVVAACDAYDSAHTLEGAADALERHLEERDDSKFSDLVHKLEGEGKSKEYATKIAAKVGREKYGAHEMAKKSAASRSHHHH